MLVKETVKIVLHSLQKKNHEILKLMIIEKKSCTILKTRHFTVASIIKRNNVSLLHFLLRNCAINSRIENITRRIS